MFFINSIIDVFMNLHYICGMKIYKNVSTWVINSAVECLPYKQKVTGSNPVLPILFRAYRLTD